MEQRLYIVKFESKRTTENFIKIGISSKPINERFSTDLKNYNIELITETRYFSSSDALIVESNFHQILKEFKYNPILQLTSGNTECFVNSEVMLQKMFQLLNFKKTKDQITPIKYKKYQTKLAGDFNRIETTNSAKRFYDYNVSDPNNWNQIRSKRKKQWSIGRCKIYK